MKYSMIVKSVAGAGILLGSLNVMATGYGGGWSRDSHTGTLINANAPDYSSSGSATAMKSKESSAFGNGWSKNSHTGTLMHTNAPSYEKQPHAAGDKQVTLNSFGGDKYQNKTTGTLTRMD
jgi:hypothetical protein